MKIILMFIVFVTISFKCCCGSHDHVHEEDPLTSYNYNLVETKVYRRRIFIEPTYTVDDYGAQANGEDDTLAFKIAWNEACTSENGLMIVPGNKVYRVDPINFEGPCISTTTIKVYGTIMASTTESSYEYDPRHWLVFNNVERLNVQGGGVIDGNGQFWWSRSCKVNKRRPCHGAPTAMTFYGCKNLRVSNITIRNAQQMHLTFQRCENARAEDLKVFSPGRSPNTDGIHVSGTRNITMERCIIKTGDDCISIVSGSTNVRATDITCGPGHGISIGSLGAGNSEAYVSDVYVNRAHLLGSTNGVRIKTWQGGYGYVQNVVFEDIEMMNVKNPIIIDQHYCDQKQPCQEQGSAVQVRNVQYKNISGTTVSKFAVKFDCSRRFPCDKISMKDINIRQKNERRRRARASCSNVRLELEGMISPIC